MKNIDELKDLILDYGLTEEEMTERLEDEGYDCEDLDSAVYSAYRYCYWFSDLKVFLVEEDIEDDIDEETMEAIKNLAD